MFKCLYCGDTIVHRYPHRDALETGNRWFIFCSELCRELFKTEHKLTRLQHEFNTFRRPSS